MISLLTIEESNNYFSELDNFFLKKEEPKEKYICCENQELYKDNTSLTCYNCGEITIDNFDVVIPKTYLNQKFHNCTLINQSVKFKNIRRLHHFQNYNYKEVVMKKSFSYITEICNKLKLSNTVIEGSKIKYKEIFLDLEISSRSNIKKAMYIYCIFFSCDYYNYEIDIEQIIEIVGIKKKHYNKVLKKLEKKNIIHSHKKIDKLLKICKENNLIINKEEMIEKYVIIKKKNIKINNNSILLGILNEMLKIKEKKFIEIFKTTRITLDKYELLK